MKYFKLLLCAITIVSVFACSSDDDSGDNGNSSANIIFTVDGVEYRFGNGVFYDSSTSTIANLDTLEAIENPDNGSSVVVTPLGTGDQAVQTIFITLDRVSYFSDNITTNVTINDSSRLEGTFQGSFRNANGSVFITVTNGSFSIDK